MAQQKKRRNSRVAQQKKSVPWGLMFLSFAVGAFVMFLIHLNDNVTPEKSVEKPKVAKTVKKSNAVEPTFEFYSLLPEMEVVVDAPTSSKRAIVTSPAKKASKTESSKTVDNTRYMLQVGSFKSGADADAHKAKLAFLGIESKVQTVTIDNKDTWHRVQVGPIIGRAKADKLKAQLQKNKIDSLLVRAKNG